MLKQSPSNLSTQEARPYASYQIRKIAIAHALGMLGTFSPPPRISDPDMHHGTCVTRVPWWMHAGVANRRFPLKSVSGKTFPAFPAMHNPQFYASGKSPISSATFPFHKNYSGRYIETYPLPYNLEYWQTRATNCALVIDNICWRKWYRVNKFETTILIRNNRLVHYVNLYMYCM